MTGSTGQIIAAGFYFLVFVPLIGYAYGRQRRWAGMLGWWLLIGGQLFLAIGGGGLFPWAGLSGFFVSAGGILLILADLVRVRRG